MSVISRTRTALPPNTLEISEPHAYLYGSREAAEAVAWHMVALDRIVAAGAPIVVAITRASIAGALVQVTYPQTGEELAQAVYTRLIGRGVPSSALRVRGEAAS